jgi:hypothetical protein
MLMCCDLLTLLERARAANVEMMKSLQASQSQTGT